MQQIDLPLFGHWEGVLGDLLDRTDQFPRSVRFTFSTRIQNTALDVLEKIVEARYARGPRKITALEEIDLGLAKLRVLLRLAHERRHLSHRGYEHLARGVDEAGRMVGGWLAERGAR